MKILIKVTFIAFFFFTNQLFAQTVSVSGRKILVNGNEYRINGICYSRGGVGNYTDDIALMKEANINTIRTYWPIFVKAELDAFAEAGIKIIMHLDENNFESYVNQYKDHPAILMWEFGNEFNYHPEWFGNDISNWYTLLETCAARVQQLDSNHPVTCAHGEVPELSVINSCPSVDVWGMNLYRWDNDVPAIVELSGRTNKAMYVSEAGADSYNKSENQEREDQQAEATENILNGIIEQFDLCAGVCIFEFCDEWWKAGNDAEQNTGGAAPNSSGVPYDGCADEEYWGIVRQDRSKKTAFTTLKDIYATVSSSPTSTDKLPDYSSDIKVHPNPVIDSFTVEVSEEVHQLEYLQIVDLSGKEVYKKALNNVNTQRIFVKLDKKLSKGTYLIKVKGKNIIKTNRIVVK